MMVNEKKTLVLVVEDDPLSLVVLTEYLRKLNLDVVVAHNGDEAIRQMNMVTPDVILLDVMMPGIDGFETCRRIKSYQAWQELPILFLTGLADSESRAKAYEAGGVDYITKPFSFQEVANRLMLRLNIKRLQQQLRERQQMLSLKESEQTSKAKALILIVDDNPFTSFTVGESLEKMGFKILKAEGHTAAFQLLQEHHIDLILLDVMMPEMDGFEVCRRLKKDARTKAIPVIFMTSLTERDHKIKAFEVGGVDYLQKPHHYRELIQRVNAHLTVQTLQRLVQEHKGR